MTHHTIPKVSAIVLNWRAANITQRCLRSLQAQDFPVDVIVVDNGSGDGSVEHLRSDGAKVLETGENLGYAGGNNVGIRAALDDGADYVWILNNDTTLAPDCLSNLMSAAATHGPAVLVPVIRRNDGRGRIWYAGGHMDRRRCTPVHWDWDATDPGPSAGRELTFATGCSLLVAREVFEATGLFDESYFLYWEDVEFSESVLQSGFAIHLVPQAEVHHDTGGSSGAVAGLSPTYCYFNIRNRIWFMRRHYPLFRRVVAHFSTVPLLARHARRVVRTAPDSRRRRQNLAALLRGVRDGVLLNPGALS